jgi:hypothetical protein
MDTLCSGDEYYLSSRAHYEEVFQLLLKGEDTYNIINSRTAFMKIIELARQALLPVKEVL